MTKTKALKSIRNASTIGWGIFITLSVLATGFIGLDAQLTSKSYIDIISYKPDSLTNEVNVMQLAMDKEKDTGIISVAKSWEGKGNVRKMSISDMESYSNFEEWTYQKLNLEEGIFQAENEKFAYDKQDQLLRNYTAVKSQLPALCTIVNSDTGMQDINPYDAIWENTHNLELGLDYCKASPEVKATFMDKAKKLADNMEEASLRKKL